MDQIHQTDISNTITDKTKFRKIIEVLMHHPYGLNAKEIASFTEINYNTCRTYCNQLYNLGILINKTAYFID